MPKPLLVITGGLLASVVLAGCGLNGNRNATPAANGTIYVRGTLKPSKSFSPATAITLSSSGSVGTTPSPTRSSSAAASSPPTTSSHRGSSSFNTVVLKAFETIQGPTQAVIGGPTKLPPAPFSGGYLTAHTHTSVHHLEINLLETSTPHAVNTVQNLNALGGIASWGVTDLTTRPVSQATALEQCTAWSTPVMITPNAPHRSMGVGSQDSGIRPVTGRQWPNTKLVWHEGNWTIELIDSNAQREERMGNRIANYLHGHALPPYPGLLLVNMAVPANDTTIVDAGGATIDWIRQSQVYSMSAATPSASNPIEVINMALSCRAWTS